MTPFVFDVCGYLPNDPMGPDPMARKALLHKEWVRWPDACPDPLCALFQCIVVVLTHGSMRHPCPRNRSGPHLGPRHLQGLAGAGGIQSTWTLCPEYTSYPKPRGHMHRSPAQKKPPQS